MEDYEDGRDANAALEEHPASGEKMISQEEMEREFVLDDRVPEFHQKTA